MLPYLIQSILLISYVIVFVYQLTTIKALKEKFTALEKFQTIFDLEKVEKYVKVIEQKAATEIEVNRRAQLSKHLKDEVEKAARNQGEELLNRYGEIVSVVANIMLEQTDLNNALLFDVLPLNKEFLERVIDEKRKNL
ncbi:MAG TPA: hypothetical protein VGI43_12755 [Mucilaginibacter sp.]|jgi:antitoxin component of RelBE/YafQ-DinJ toxin-antitoxin module